MRQSGRDLNNVLGMDEIWDFPNHATFRVKAANLAWLEKFGFFFSLNLCNKANF